MPRAGAAFAAATGLAALAVAALDTRALALGLLLAGVAVIAGAVAWLESGPDHAREIVVVATISAVAAIGHVVLHPLPGVQPVTLIVVATGAALGARAGVAVGLVSAFVSNFALGQGPWTVWQMLAWGLCGAVGAALAPVLTRRTVFAIVLGLLGLAFSGFLDVWSWSAYYDQHTWSTFAANAARGFPFDVAHAVGNVVFALLAGPELLRLLGRYGRRLRTEVVWA
jgi:energy-coupling factor transport system substrate-specific component